MKSLIRYLIVFCFVFQMPFVYSGNNQQIAISWATPTICVTILTGLTFTAGSHWVNRINTREEGEKNREEQKLNRKQKERLDKNAERRHQEKLASDKLNREEQKLNREQKERHHKEKMELENLKMKWKKMNKKQKKGLIEQCTKQDSSLAYNSQAEYEQWKNNLDIEKYIQKLDDYMIRVDNDRVKKVTEGVKKLGDKLVSNQDKKNQLKKVENRRSVIKRTRTEREKEQDAKLVSELTKEFLKWDLDQNILNNNIFYGSEEQKAYNAHVISNLVEKYKELGYHPAYIYKYFFWQGGPSEWITKYEEKNFGNEVAEKAIVLVDPHPKAVEEGYPARAEDYLQEDRYLAGVDGYNPQNYREPLNKQLQDLESMGVPIERYGRVMGGYSNKGSGVLGGNGPPIEFDPIIIRPPLGGGGGGSSCVCYSDLDEKLSEMDIVFLCGRSFCQHQLMR